MSLIAPPNENHRLPCFVVLIWNPEKAEFVGAITDDDRIGMVCFSNRRDARVYLTEINRCGYDAPFCELVTCRRNTAIKAARHEGLEYVLHLKKRKRQWNFTASPVPREPVSVPQLAIAQS